MIPFSATEKPPPQAIVGYEAVRLNAMKHGILSKLAVLAHEDHAEFDDLLAALLDEHRPAGITERHLIEELAAIIWRKRRVLMAEAAKINEGLKAAVNNPKSVMTSAAPFQRGLADENTRLSDLMTETPEQIAETQRDAELDLAATRKASAILYKGGPNAYEKALRALRQDSRDWWQVQIEEEEHPSTAEGLAQFISESLDPLCFRATLEARYTPAIKAQALGEGLQVHRLEKLNRYETHLDRKFERTLAMLLKLKDLRSR
ncbi:MAG: hypothetical protein IPK02_05240 [Candidatus Accumulibacter sp.]|uniref:Uncharacterized protein n=1 Tax=Candidatus Accumulibacter affinis TaxID=2954384 RepID=A0A935TBJ9_9PROT|nr:hypothetical protein [Candidatus Accumulibacter affinis]